MRKPRFHFVEPSKVGPQHITLIDGYLRALQDSSSLRGAYDLVFYGSRSTFANLAREVSQELVFSPIPVMNPEKRRLIRKTILEFFVLVRILLSMRHGDLLFTSCQLPTTLIGLEWAVRLLRRRRAHASLHGEVEGLFDSSVRGIGSYGFWITRWANWRRPDSQLGLVVIDDFIRERLLQAFPHKLNGTSLSVVYHPVTAVKVTGTTPMSGDVCFIGFRTRYKGFESFVQLAHAMPALRFVAIGGGRVEDVVAGTSASIQGNNDYLQSIAGCSIAMFLYSGGYTCSFSAAVLDAISTGVHVIATPRECFLALREHLGGEFVTIIDTVDQATALLHDTAWVANQRSQQASRLQRIDSSRYGIESVRACFEQLASTPL